MKRMNFTFLGRLTTFLVISAMTFSCGKDEEDSENSSDIKTATSGSRGVNSDPEYLAAVFLKATTPAAYDYMGNSVAIDGAVAVIGAEGDDAAYVFRKEAGSWSFEQKLTASNAETATSDDFGTSVAVSGNVIVVGAPSEDGNGVSESDNSNSASGAAYVFRYASGTWTQEKYLKVAAANLDASDSFGTSVAINEAADVIVVGAPGEDSTSTSTQTDDGGSNTGAAYVFRYASSAWSEEKYLKANNISSSDSFGQSVAINEAGTIIAVGAPYEDTSATDGGAVYVFRYSSSAWAFEDRLNGTGVTSYGYLGTSVSASGSVVVTGAPVNNQAYVFRYGTAWDEEAVLTNSSSVVDYFGQSVDVSGTRIVVGAILEDSDGKNGSTDNSEAAAGAAFVFDFDGDDWNLSDRLKAKNAGSADYFGAAVALSDSHVLVGAPYEDSNDSNSMNDNSTPDSGAAYIFTNIAPER